MDFQLSESWHCKISLLATRHDHDTPSMLHIRCSRRQMSAIEVSAASSHTRMEGKPSSLCGVYGSRSVIQFAQSDMTIAEAGSIKCTKLCQLYRSIVVIFCKDLVLVQETQPDMRLWCLAACPTSPCITVSGMHLTNCDFPVSLKMPCA